MTNELYVGVVGAGTMGHGIAQVFAEAGYSVLLHDVSQEVLAKAKLNIEASLAKRLKKNVLTENEVKEAKSNIRYSAVLEEMASTHLVIEAVVENIEVKKEIFKKLDAICKTETILASNTSSISLTVLAGFTKRSQQVIGMHFMNPVPLMRLIEVIRAKQTSDEVFQIIRTLSEKLGKTPVEAADYPGFLSNRILMPMINEAICALHEGVGTVEAIDTVMKLGMSHPMGPLTLADLIGLDTCLSVMNVLYEGFQDSKYRPCPLLKQMVAAGELGRKSGKGFYSYS